MYKLERLPCTSNMNISSTRYYVYKPYLHSFINVCLTRKSVLNVHWKGWCWSWNSNICIRKVKKQKVSSETRVGLANWCKELTHWNRPWCWERLKGAGEGDNRGWDGWMASLTRWTWVWASFGSWWRTGKPGVLQSMESQRVRHDWVTELNWLTRNAEQYHLVSMVI